MPEEKKGISFTDILRTQIAEPSAPNSRSIHYKSLVEHESSHYLRTGIEALADSIGDLGLLQDLLVKKGYDNKYVIVAGHRRYLAIKMLVEDRGRKDLERINCCVLEEEEDSVITELKLHATNMTTRELSENEKMLAIASMKSLIVKARARGYKIKGKVRDLIGQSVNLRSTQVQKYLTISEQASPEVKEALARGEMTVENAYKTTRPEEQQDMAGGAEKNKTKEPFDYWVKLVDLAIHRLNNVKKLTRELEDKEIEALVEELEKRLDKEKIKRSKERDKLMRFSGGAQ